MVLRRALVGRRRCCPVLPRHPTDPAAGKFATSSTDQPLTSTGDGYCRALAGLAVWMSYRWTRSDGRGPQTVLDARAARPFLPRVPPHRLVQAQSRRPRGSGTWLSTTRPIPDLVLARPARRCSRRSGGTSKRCGDVPPASFRSLGAPDRAERCGWRHVCATYRHLQVLSICSMSQGSVDRRSRNAQRSCPTDMIGGVLLAPIGLVVVIVPDLTQVPSAVAIRRTLTAWAAASQPTWWSRSCDRTLRTLQGCERRRS